MLTSKEIRSQFIDYFVKRHGHTFVPSSPVVPHDDPTLLFANAGMNQFKDVFLGTGSRPYNRAANTQKCIRAGGKHNDLEDVGKDTYHHTFFEMLGNWSFGDYFKKEAIAWAWELLTKQWGMDKSRLHATVFAGDPAENLAADEEAAQLWRTVTDIDPSHVHLGSKKDNFWEMGETGPCGPCSEIHIDLTPGKDGGKLVNAGDPRVMEIWNLVFIQFNRNASGQLTPLPAKHVDTGMGFERVCAVLQGKNSNYDTDVFAPLFAAIQDVTKARPYGGSLEDRVDMAYRVLADHVRCLTFAITDGAVPSNEGRGYVLRRILRRAVRHGRQTLGMHEPFLYRLAETVVETMGEAFPELLKKPQFVEEVIKEEEESFGRTIDRGIALFEQAAAKAGKGKRIEAQDAFKLHDTFGFPLDLTQVMAQERGLTVDVAGFEKLMEQAREVSRGGEGGVDPRNSLPGVVQHEKLPGADFVGYEQTELTAKTSLRVFALSSDGREYAVVKEAPQGTAVALATGVTPFYAESGGQVGDTGVIEFVGPAPAGAGAVVRVKDTIKVGETIFHLGVVEKGTLRDTPEAVTLEFRVDAKRRAAIMANHSATHTLNQALRAIVNPQADQKGSLVDEQKLRFDFTHSAGITDEQLEAVERMVNEKIAADLPIYYGYAPQTQALTIRGLRAVFGEKYPPTVRVVSQGVPVEKIVENPGDEQWAQYAIELCGGTHLKRLGDAEGFVIVSEEAVGKGIRRITALTKERGHAAQAQAEMLLSRLGAMKNATQEELAAQLPQLIAAMNEATLPAVARAKLRVGIAELQKTLKEHQKQQSRAGAETVVEAARKIAEEANGELIIAEVPGADGHGLRTAMDVIRKKLPGAAMLLAAVSDGKIAFLAAVPEDKIKKGLKAGDWVREVAKAAGGGGGGRPDMAQAGGKDPQKLEEALRVGREFAEAKL